MSCLSSATSLVAWLSALSLYDFLEHLVLTSLMANVPFKTEDFDSSNVLLFLVNLASLKRLSLTSWKCCAQKVSSILLNLLLKCAFMSENILDCFLCVVIVVAVLHPKA